ncbi:flagellar assembly protein H [Phormidium willei BDU 130791]|nr:flagellar assembly protein H [Phormidium willei BDU 130791]
MKTDSIFYRIFQQYPRSLFDLLQRPSDEAQEYQFTSVEVKQLAFRLDGLFLPTGDRPQQPLYLVEVQFQADDTLYYRLFAELFLYLRQYRPSHPWRVVVIYPTRRTERPELHQFQDWLECDRVTRIYLNELPDSDCFGVNLMKLVVEPESAAIESAQVLIQQTQERFAATPLQRDLIDLIETIVVYKLPNASREEIAQMLGITDLKQTRFYQEAFLEGQEAEQRKLIRRLRDRNYSPEDIAQLLDVSVEEVQRLLT